MDNRDNWFACGVCGDKTRVCYLKTNICRACGAFYRRAVTEGLKYTCQFKERCNLDYRSRKICAACRFNRCKQLRPRLKNDSSQLEVSPLLVDSNRIYINESLIDFLVSGYDWFMGAQRNLHVIKHPDVDFSNGKNLLVIDRSETIKMIMDSLPLMFTVFNQFYKAFGGLPGTQKIKLAANVAYHFMFIDKAYLTSHFYPTINDCRMAMTNGYYVEHARIDIKGYVYGLFMNKELENFLNLYKPISTRRFENFQKFKQLKLKKHDAACMMFLTICRFIEYAGILNDEFTRLQETLLHEWYARFKAENSESADVSKKFAQIFNYYLETNSLVTDMIRTMTILSINNQQADVAQVHDVDACIKKLSETPSNTQYF